MDGSKIIVASIGDNFLHVKDLSNIVYLESFGRKTKTYCCEGEEYLVKISLSEVEKRLPDEQFYKIHKSFIINIDYLKGINLNPNKTVLLHNGIELNIAHRKYKDFVELLKRRFDFWQ